MALSSPAALSFGLLLACSACTTEFNADPYVQATPGPLTVTIATEPDVRADGTVPRNVRFVVQLDGYPDPDSVGYGPLTLHSGAANFDIDVSIRFVARQILVTPRSPLAPGVQYDLVASSLVSLDDRVQADQVVGSVHVGTDDGTPFPAPPRPTWNGDPVTGGGIRAILGTCAPFCHSPVGASGRTRTPTRLLDLTGDPRDPVFGLLNVPSVGLRGTPVDLLRVSPSDPAHSVLLRKLLGGNPQADSRDPPYPNMRVDGRRMPIPLDESAPADVTLSDTELQSVEDWIAAGAPVD
jgi:hypothetical protein